MDLAGSWRLSDEVGEYDVPFALPGDGVTALHAAGVIPDPYWGLNEYGLRWIADRDWTASRNFDHDGGDCELVIDGLDTVAEVRLNGMCVLRAANAHRRWRVPVAGLLRAGDNRIDITFRSVVREGAARQAAQPFPIPYHQPNCPIPNGNMLRKPQCDFGWDWNIALPTFGLWGKVALDPVAERVGDIIVAQRHDAGLAEVSLRVETTAADATATLCGVTATAPAVNGTATLTLRIPKPQLWWPAGQGAQVLHDLVVTAGTATATRRIGLRDIRLVSEPDAAGRSFGFAVNGRPVFAKGANWIPADALHGRITQGAVRDLLQSALDAHMNMIRVWGGGRYEPDWFYDLCDELGLMVWQDFMFACHLYPSTPDFLTEVAEEIRDVVGRLNHHACIALWCGDNELIGALGWFEESRRDRDRYLVNYDRLNRTIESALFESLPGANWWPSSPSPGPLAFGDAWHDDSSGDMHFWSVWHEGRDFDHYRDVKPRFCSEFGFQSYPSLSAIATFADRSDWNIAAPVMESHQKNAGGNARIAETMFRTFRFPVDFPSFVYLSQVQQGVAIHTAVTAWRALKPHCMGALYWQLNDTWPVCSWSSLDHGGNWKLLHHMAWRFFAPITVIAVPQADTITLKAVNDLPDEAYITLHVQAVNMAGQIRPLVETDTTLCTKGATPCTVIDRAQLQPDEVLHWHWSDGARASGADIFSPRAWKTFDLVDPKISQSVARDGDDWLITLKSHALAPFTALEADLPGRFSDNAFALIPGQDRMIRFTPSTEGTPRFTLRHLHAATYGT
ncbi:MAG: glycoside hydrolase family 2 protein [Pseudotabrizicola sp.]|uniref:beta-mannosidase n=1 Tax=Pseudotabrizicola sp. TaxID=2939647 RepID=UPI00273212D0|nr:glycoside hydrolase family 2 protein [Pseudotabrizicola sp.]MDP2082851.1 glycoside hydrolase family 2 protein [Pseudotabrizicola sp.]MDZ7574384.1 glycoside hydrolase family 2 protein [Pseudotabrizicola sp.]